MGMNATSVELTKDATREINMIIKTLSLANRYLVVIRPTSSWDHDGYKVYVQRFIQRMLFNVCQEQ